MRRSADLAEGEPKIPMQAHPRGATGNRVVSNAEIADRLASLAQLLSTQKENPYKVRAYQRAAAKIRTLSESLDQLVHDEADLTQFAGIGAAIASAIREIVLTGALTKLEDLRASASPAVKTLNGHPRLDPKRVLRVYKKLGIASVEELRERLNTGDIERLFGSRMAQHVRQGLTEAHAILLYKADDLRLAVEEYLLNRCGVRRAEAAGDYRRRVEVVEELVFVVEANDFPSVVAHVERYGGRTPLITSGEDDALFSMSSGVLLRLRRAARDDWGIHMVSCTGSKAHLKQLNALAGKLRPGKSGEIAVPTEATFYRGLGLQYIEPELREGGDEIERAARNALPRLVTKEDFRGDPTHRVSRNSQPEVWSSA